MYNYIKGDMMKKLLILFSFILLLTGCTKNNESYNMFYMDTYIEVKVYDISKKDSKEVFSKIDSIYKKYHELSDRYNECEDVVNIYYLNNILKKNEEVTISDELRDLINYGIDAYDDTDGYINIALGNVIDIWKKYREEGSSIPSTYELMNAGSIEISDILLKDNTYKKTSGVKIDLGAYSKGYTTEIVGDYLESIGYDKYLINAGGNVKVGSKYKSCKYTIGLEEPFNESNLYKKVYVENNSIVTSGSYQRYYEVDGVNYNHIINPKTLFPENYTKSVTVITNDSAYADIMSTYLFLLPIDDGIEYVNNNDLVEAIWYSDELYYSNGFNIYE